MRYYAVDRKRHGYPDTYRCSECFDPEQFPGASVVVIEHNEEVREDYAGTFCDFCNKALAQPDANVTSVKEIS